MTELKSIQCDKCLKVIGVSEMEIEEVKFCLSCAKEVFAEKKVIVFSDGSGWNGKKSRACITNEEGEVIESYETTEEKTNNEMEYKGVIMGLMYFMENEVNSGILKTDSQLVEGHINKNWKLNAENLKGSYELAKRLVGITNAKIEYISRKENKAGWIFEK